MNNFMKGFIVTGAIVGSTVLGIGIWKAVTCDLTEEEREAVDKIANDALDDMNRSAAEKMRSILEENEKEIDRQFEEIKKQMEEAKKNDQFKDELERLINTANRMCKEES